MDYPFESDPRFAKLPYSDQQQIRVTYASKQLQQDQRFLNLPDTDKMLILQNVMKRPPVFENPKLGEAFASAAKNPVAFQTFANADKQSGVIGIALGLASKIVPDMAVQKEMLFGADASKGAAYIQNLIDSNESLSPIVKMLPKLGTIVGFAADLASYAAATGLAPTKTIAGSAEGIAQRVTQNMARLGASGVKMQLARWALADLAPHAARAIAQGLTGIVRENILRLENGEGVDTSIGDIAKTFGTYAAGDTLFWHAVQWGAPFLKLAGQTLKTFGKSSRAITESLYMLDAAGKKRAFLPGELADYEQAMIRGDLPEVLFQTASPSVQDHLTAMRDRQMYAANPEIAQRDPFGKTTLAAGSIGLDVVQLPDGGYRVRHPLDVGATVDVPTLGKLDEALVSYMRERKGLFNIDELRTDPLRGHLVRMMDAQDGIDASLKGFKSEAARADFIPLTERGGMSPIEAEAAKASSFSGAGQSAVTDVFHIPLSEASLTKVAKEKSLLPNGADAMPLSKEGGTPNVFVTAGKVATPEEFKAAQDWAGRAANAGNKAPSPELVATALRRAGYDGAYLPDGTFLSLYPDRQVKVLDNTLSPKTGRSGFVQPVRLKTEDVQVSLKGLKGTVPDALIGGDNKLLGALLKTDQGKPNLPYASRASSMMLARMGAKDSRAVVTVLDDATEITTRATKQGVHVFTPPSVTDFGAKLAKALANHVSEEGKTLRSTIIKEATVSLPEDALNTKNLKTWFANLSERDPLVKGWIAKNAVGLDPLEAVKKLALAETTPSLLKVEMAQLGVRVVGGEGNLKAIRGGKVIASGRTAEELLAASGIDPKLPSKFAPKIVGLNPDSITFEVTGVGVKGGPKDIWKLMDSFDDYAAQSVKRKLFSSGEGELTIVSPGKYEVTIPAYGVRKAFSSLEDAKVFVQGEWKSWGALKDRIESAGGMLRHENGKYVVHLAGSRIEATTLPELASTLRDLPEPSHMPDLVGEDVSLYYKEGAPQLDFEAFRPKYVDLPPAATNPKFFSSISMLFKPMGAWITGHAQKLGAIEVLKQYNNLEAGVRLASRDSDLMLELIGQMHDSLGKWRPGQRWHQTMARKSEGLFYLLGEPIEGNRASIIERFGLGEKELAVETRLRKMLGTGPNDSEGLFAKFGLDPYKFIYGYMSRVRAATDAESILHLNHPEAGERILEKTFTKDGVPNEIKAWFENMRDSEVISFALDTNVFSVMRRYITRGNLRLYAGEPWRNMVSLLNRPETDKILRWRTMRYMDMLQGGGFTDGEKLMQQFSAAFQKALGKGDAAVAGTYNHDLLRTIYAVSYTTHLGWRPFVAIRNLMQMYQTVGPLAGNTYMRKAIEFLSTREGGGYINELRRRGIIHQAPPIVNQLADGEHILAKLQDSSLSMFKTADDITRGVGYRAGEMRFEDGMKAFGSINIDNAKRFAEYVGSNLYGPEMNSRILEATIAGKTDVAKHVFANALQERALFLMRREQSPVAFHGVVGKMFGQYGTFAANYVQFVAQTWKYATPAQKAIFATRWIGNSAALAAGMYAIGLRGRDWMPWAPAQFTGGPLFNIAIDLIHSVGSDYQARQARGELNRMLPIDINKLIKGEGLELQPPVGMPTYYQIRTLTQMVKYAGEGDAWKSFLALLSAPIRSE
jgi:hypothetical protein